MKKQKLITRFEVIFLALIVVWILAWSLGFMSHFTSYLNANPWFPIPIAFLIHQSGYTLSYFAISWVLLRKVSFATRLGLGITFLFIAFEISAPPTCVAPDGTLLLKPDNYSCLMGNDTLMSWIFNIFGIQYGTSLMYYMTYIIGTILFAFMAVLLLKEKELWRALASR